LSPHLQRKCQKAGNFSGAGMKIKITFLRVLDIKKVESGSSIEVKDGCTARELLEYLEIKKERFSSVTVVVNDIPVWSSTVLKENDNVQLLVSLGGG
jgi:sulfur carrier protein ThiS